MTVVVVVPGQAEPWQVSNAAFRLLVEEVRAVTSDAEFMTRAAALTGWDLALVTPDERKRQAALLAHAARRLRNKLLSRPALDHWELSLAGYLPVLEMWMEGLQDE